MRRVKSGAEQPVTPFAGCSAVNNYLLPVRAIPLIKCFWNTRNKTVTGIITSADADMVALKSLPCWVEKKESATGRVMLSTFSSMMRGRR